MQNRLTTGIYQFRNQRGPRPWLGHETLSAKTPEEGAARADRVDAFVAATEVLDEIANLRELARAQDDHLYDLNNTDPLVVLRGAPTHIFHQRAGGPTPGELDREFRPGE